MFKGIFEFRFQAERGLEKEVASEGLKIIKYIKIIPIQVSPTPVAIPAAAPGVKPDLKHKLVDIIKNYLSLLSTSWFIAGNSENIGFVPAAFFDFFTFVGRNSRVTAHHFFVFSQSNAIWPWSTSLADEWPSKDFDFY